MGLVVEAAGRGDGGGRLPCGQERAGAADPQVALEGVGRQAELGAEAADELVAGEAAGRRAACSGRPRGAVSAGPGRRCGASAVTAASTASSRVRLAGSVAGASWARWSATRSAGSRKTTQRAASGGGASDSLQRGR